MIRKIFVMFFLTYSLLAKADVQPDLTLDQVVRAIGRLIVNQDKVKSGQNKLQREITDLQNNFKELKSNIHTSKEKTYMFATVLANANIRKEPSISSQKIGTASLCSMVKIRKCEYNDGSIWCKIDNGYGYINKRLLSFERVEFHPKKNYKYYTYYYKRDRFLVREPHVLEKTTVNGISLDKKWSCLSNGYFLYNEQQHSNNVKNTLKVNLK